MQGTLVPAYGRDYKSKKEALADWSAGRDFRLESFDGGGYANRPQCEELGGKRFQIRWKKLTMVAVITYDAAKNEWK